MEQQMPKLLRFKDLKERGIVDNRVTLSRRIKDHGFPPGFLLGPNSRAWTEDVVEAWLKARPVEREAVA
jgi:predicted DNA-binding transcriptional regulator AlpA